MKCRYCNSLLKDIVINLEEQPSANRLLTENELQLIKGGQKEHNSPLITYICDNCSLVQLGDTTKPEELFTEDYVYYSSFSKYWVQHARELVEFAIQNFRLTSSSNILEIGSNDGYLLQHFVAKKIPCIGIDPAGKAAEAAKAKGVETVVSFFDEVSSSKLIRERGTFDFINGINVFAHVPAIKTFITSLKNCLSENGVISLEFPHLAKLVEHSQFDTIYDEHFFYHSLVSLNKIFLQFDLKIFDLRELDTHGGSLRIFISHLDNTKYSIEKSVVKVLNTELSMKLDQVGGFNRLKARSQQIRDDAVAYIKAQKKIGKKIAAFGAAAKGNVFLNYCGIDADSIDFVVDDTPAKQGKFLPGSHIPVVPATEIINKKPDIIVILPWNLRSEISKKLKSNEKWQGELVTFIPKLNII